MANSDWVHADRDFQNAPMFVRVARWLKYRTSRGISDPIHIEIDMGDGRRHIADVFVTDFEMRFPAFSPPCAMITVETSVGQAVLRCLSADAFAAAIGWIEYPESHTHWITLSWPRVHSDSFVTETTDGQHRRTERPVFRFSGEQAPQRS